MMQKLSQCPAGCLKRATGSTYVNGESSRSHAICTINISFTKERDEHSAAGPTQVTSKIHLVDLAGSERLKQILHKGESTQETRQINKGLHALSKVISALAGKQNPLAAAVHVPYRDSKLTRLLQDSLGGSAHTLMISCVSPADECVQETLSTLQYASRARRIQNMVVPPREASGGKHCSLAGEIQQLQWQLLKQYLMHAGLMPVPEVLLKV
jgi:kinesin family protein 4/21/27